ncbi:ABC transporter G family member 29-like protein, partial [Tanacetum coccineum]
RIPNGWQWAYWVSPLSYSFNALATNEFSAQRWMNKLENDKSSKLGVAILQNIRLTPDRNLFWIRAAALLSLAVVFNILFTLALAYVDGGEVIYSGPLGLKLEKFVEYLKGIPGIPKIVDERNPATWMLDVTSVATELNLGIDLAQHYKSSSVYQTHIIVGMGVGGLDVICVKQKPSSTILPGLTIIGSKRGGDLPFFLEFQVPRQWAPLHCELPLRHQQRKSSYPWLQFAFMGLKIYVSTTQFFAKIILVSSNDKGAKVLKEAKACAKKKTMTSKILKDNVVKVDQDLHQKFIDNVLKSIE